MNEWSSRVHSLRGTCLRPSSVLLSNSLLSQHPRQLPRPGPRSNFVHIAFVLFGSTPTSRKAVGSSTLRSLSQDRLMIHTGSPRRALVVVGGRFECPRGNAVPVRQDGPCDRVLRMNAFLLGVLGGVPLGAVVKTFGFQCF